MNKLFGIVALGLTLGAGTALAQPIVVDGDVSEWPTNATFRADKDWLYFRVRVEGELQALQASSRTLSLWLDVDGSVATGYAGVEPDAARALGIDLEVQFSPLNKANGEPDSGVAAYQLFADGGFEKLTHADLGLSFAPTYGSEWYEGRISRHMPEVGGLPDAGLRSKGTIAGMFVLMNGAGDILSASDVFSVRAGARAEERLPANVEIPAKGRGDVRIMNFNVLKSSPVTDPDRFGRIIRAVNPDILLLQEWDEGDAALVEGWLNANAAPEGSGNPWVVVKGEPQGVAVAARHALRPMGDPLRIDSGDNARAVRWVGAIVSTPIGDLGVSSVHLKCCGSYGSTEDLRRSSEATAINQALEAFRSEVKGLVLGGDMNLVGSRPPLDMIRSGLDADGTDMETVPARVLGDSIFETWWDAKSQFSPGRLDWVTFSDSRLRISRSFVLDTRRLSDAALNKAGLDRGDSAASDHMPVVVDLRAR